MKRSAWTAATSTSPTGVLTVRDSKFGKSARGAAAPTAPCRRCSSYAQLRDRLCPHPTAPSFLITTRGTRPCSSTHPCTRSAALLEPPGSGTRSRAATSASHDLRHSFAVKTLLGWYRDGGDVQARLPLLSTYLGHVDPADTYWYLSAAPELLALAAERLEHATRGARSMTALAPTLEAFFTDRLIAREGRQPAHDRRLPRHLPAAARLRADSRPASSHPQLELDDLDAPLIGAFLDHLEHERGNSVRTRNARLAAIHSLFRYAALRHPEHAALISRVLAIPTKRCERAIVTYLTAEEVNALLAAPDRDRWIGRRDHALLTLTIQTGLRVSELTGLRCQDVHLGTGAHVHCLGKGRKHRATPLTRQTVAVLRELAATNATGDQSEPLFPTSRGRPLSRDAVARLVAKHARTAATRCPTLQEQDDLAAHAAAHRRDEPAARRRRQHRHRPLARPRIARARPRSTSTPTCRSKNAPSRAPRRPAPPPAATGHPTTCSRSSKRSDYAEESHADPSATQRSRPSLGITRRSA